MKNQKAKRNILIAVAAVAVALVLVFSVAMGKIARQGISVDVKPSKSFAVINIIGTIQAGNTGSARVGYDHDATLNYIDELINDDTNTGIFLDVNSGGGTVYESDEMYLKLMEYKEKTGRPIHAYFNSMAASGAYYISCAADNISANRNCWTGSIGVIISTSNLSGLYDKLGIEEVLIVSGRNKGMGSSGSKLTDEQRAIYQSLVDESYEQFVDIVANARGLSVERTKEIADGRIYSANQALDAGLIDSIKSYDEAISYMTEVTGSVKYYKPLYTPTAWEKMMSDAQDLVPKSEAEIAQNLVQSELCGVPLYMYVK